MIPQTMPPTLQKLGKAFQDAFDAKRYVEAAALGLYAVSLGERQPDTLYNTACALALAGDLDRAFSLLDQARKAGFEDAALLQRDENLAPLHDDKRWPKLVALVVRAAEERLRQLADPDRAPFVTEDIPRFWSAYDHALRQPQVAARTDIFQREYFDRATPGMKDWVRVRRASAAHLAQFVTDHPRFFATIRPATLMVAKQRPTTVAAFRRFKALYPAAQFPATTFCIGAFYGGGTVSGRSLLMSAEMYTATPQTPTDELGRWQKLVLSPTHDLPYIIAHEMIHFQQRYAPFDRTLLRSCIQEGCADFLGELCSGSVGQFHEGEVFLYGHARERELWEKFQADMLRFDKNNVWLYSDSGEGKRPDDLGYFMGYRICEAYYKNVVDKKQAVHDLLNISDFRAFLKASRYAEKFTTTSSSAHWGGAS